MVKFKKNDGLDGLIVVVRDDQFLFMKIMRREEDHCMMNSCLSIAKLSQSPAQVENNRQSLQRLANFRLA